MADLSALAATALAAAVLLGFTLKGLTGFSEAILLVAVGAWLLDPLALVALVALVDVVGGGAAALLTRRDSPDLPRRWLAAAAAGSLVGAGAIVIATAPVATALFAASLAGTTAALLLRHKVRPGGPVVVATLAASGVAGSTSGLDGPLALTATSTTVATRDLPTVLTRVLLAGSAARAIPFAATGALTTAHLGYALAALPLCVVGFALGRRFHRAVPDRVVTTAMTVLCGIAVVGALLRLVLM